MVSSLISTIKSGARANKYRIIIPIMNANIVQDIDFTVQSSSMPGKTITPVEVYIKGRKIQMRGETNLENTWDITFYNKNDLSIRNLLISWIELIHNNKYEVIERNPLSDIEESFDRIGDALDNTLGNPFGFNGENNLNYQKDITIEQLDQNGEAITKVLLIGAFPITVGPIELDDSNGNISTSTCTFAFTDIQVL